MATQRDIITKSRIDLDIRAAITDQLNAHGRSCSASEIYRYLNLQQEFVGRVPQLRSIQRIVKEYRDQHPIEEWHWSQYPAEDARIILDVMEVVDNFKDLDPDERLHAVYKNRIDPETGDPIIVAKLDERLYKIPEDFQWTNRFAEWVVKISKAAPEISPVSLFQIARYYLLSFDLNVTTEGLDVLLAMRAWQSNWNLWRYVKRVSLNQRPKISVPGGHLDVLLSLYLDVVVQTKIDEGVNLDEDLVNSTAQLHEEIERLIWEGV